MEDIRNFCIIAHIDHGKSTLADRLLELTKTLSSRDMEAQVLDNMDLEKEKGITIKSHAIQMEHYKDGKKYILNLIDTPGHVDFSYEVSRSIASCEGALLVVDASQGIQAQTISNLYLAIDHGLEIIPVLNKIDMDSARPDVVCDEVCDLLGCTPEEVFRVSARTGEGVAPILDAIVDRIPCPKGNPDGPLQALVFDSVFNSFRGVIAYFKVVNGSIRTGDKVKFVSTGEDYCADEVGVLKLKLQPTGEISCGNVGYIISGIKSASEVKVGDTITHVDNPCDKAIAGFEEVKPMVFAGMYPVDASKFEELRSVLEKFQLNDASFVYEPESSLALGSGFRCGFLGLLHLEIVQERLFREFNMDVITTVPNVSYKVFTTQGEVLEVHNPSGMPAPTLIDHIEEPFIRAQIISKSDFFGAIMKLCLDRRGTLVSQHFITADRVELNYDMPLSEIVFGFYDSLKTISKGYASFDYHITGYRPARLVRLDILLNGEPADALSSLIHEDNAYDFGRKMCVKLKDLIPRQQFDIPIQAAIGAKIIARETVKQVRKDVTAKCYGGDVTRKRKLLEKQKEGKKRMRQIGTVQVPQSAFMAVLKLE
ncbi:MAG: translation elongation factor 4 [Bacteroidales bacterium]|uniref:translation elongation factor 4 n=1 Tax=Candidatus Cryptobacteroides sp. TaxID=2952915 RepID=UPI002A755E1C|nr:translation elongation factor 4 [Candidatus Cryptobacteroides sp.]MCI6525684.1 translation elongation factor 4 [Bacteroidales bacterium]MDD7235041.1 translation elongation factor 4 [Bacteroidales bacterium]MDY2701109.1 translation elongation factor 4 [Candidatus Cryptobacteroides sp.]MDY5317466.1 translation elongation factor 4 [Candidatus Cryptobacteroides sp.]